MKRVSMSRPVWSSLQMPCSLWLLLLSCSVKMNSSSSESGLEDVFFHPQSLSTEEGHDVFFQCVSGDSFPRAQISWLKNGRVLTMGNQIQGQYGGGSQKKTSGTLHMANVTKADQGFYVCVTYNPLLNISKESHAATLTVYGSGMNIKIIEGPQNITVAVETEAALHCVVEGFPIPTVQWFKDGHPLLNTSRWSLQKNGQLMVFQRVLSEDEGFYFCEVSNEKEKVISQPAYLLPAVMDWTLNLEPFKITVRKEDSATLPCRPPQSRPQTQVTWYKNNQPLHPGLLHTTDTNGDLHIHSVQATDTGYYFCRASNSYVKRAIASKKIFLDVLEPPSVTIWPKVVTSPVGGEVEVHCQVSGHPAPVIKWSKQGRSVQTGGKIITGVRNSTLYISSVKVYDEGLYTCSASNTAGHDEKTMTLHVAEKPVIISFIASVTVSEGSRVSLPCRAVGDFPVKYTWIRTALIRETPELSAPASLPQQIHIDDNGTLVISSIHRADAGEYYCTAQNRVGQDMRRAIITVTAEPDVLSDKAALSENMPTVSESAQDLLTDVNRYESKFPSSTEINKPIQQATEDYTKIPPLNAFMEDSPTHFHTNSAQDMTQFVSLKPAGINKGSNEHIRTSIETQKPTTVPTNPTSFLKLQDTQKHVQPTQQIPEPSVMNPNTTQTDSYNFTQNIQSQNQTSGLTLLDAENVTASTFVENQHNQSQITEQSEETKTSVTNNTDLVESLKKNTSQAPMRTTDNNTKEKVKSQTWWPVIEKQDIPIVVGVCVSLAFIFIAMAFYSLVQKNEPGVVPTGRAALRCIGGPCRLAMERSYDNKAFEDDNSVAVIEQSPNTSETRALPPEPSPSAVPMEPSSSDDQQSGQDLPVIVETHPEPREEDQNTKEDILKKVHNRTAVTPIHFYCMDTKPMQLETIFEEGKATPSAHSDIQLQCMDDWRSREFEAGLDAPSPPPPNPPPAHEEGLRSSLTLQTSEPCSTPVRHSINISHGLSPLLLSHCVSLGMTSVAVDVHFYPSAPSAASHTPSSAFRAPGQQINTRLEQELTAPSASHSK